MMALIPGQIHQPLLSATLESENSSSRIEKRSDGLQTLGIIAKIVVDSKPIGAIDSQLPIRSVG